MKRKVLWLTMGLLLGTVSFAGAETIVIDEDKSRAVAHKATPHAPLSKKNSQSLGQSKRGEFSSHEHKLTLREYHEKTRPEDEGRVSEIFYNNFDRLGHSVHEIEQDMTRIKVLNVKK